MRWIEADNKGTNEKKERKKFNDRGCTSFLRSLKLSTTSKAEVCMHGYYLKSFHRMLFSFFFFFFFVVQREDGTSR